MVARTAATPRRQLSSRPKASPVDPATRVEGFVQLLRQSKGDWAGRAMQLLPWQQDLIRTLFGTLRPDGARQYRTAYVEVPRKNGKSSLAAALALYMLVADNEAGAEVYLAAVDRDQASIVFGIAADMVRQSEALMSKLQIIPSTRRIINFETSSVLRVIASDASGSHGFNASAVIADEVHAWPNRELWDVLATSTGSRRQPLMIGITTAGHDRDSLAYSLREYGERVRDGILDDPTFHAALHGAAATDDWTDPAVWRAANPSIDVTISEEYLAGECARARSVPAYESAFRRLHLCQWVTSETRWLPLAAWDACAGPTGFADLPTALEGQRCWGGLDLSATTDLTALVLVFPRDDGTYSIVPHFWLPADGLRERGLRDRVPYDVWQRQGALTLTPGTSIDMRHVRETIRALATTYQLEGVAYDRWSASTLIAELADDDIALTPFSQGMASMAGPTRELLSLTLAGRLAHGSHPVLRWQADNLVVREDEAGNVKPTKAKARQRIDGMVALIMGIDLAQREHMASGSIYEDRGILVL